MRNEAEKRDVTVFHFTRVLNLPNILAHGLIPRQKLEETPWVVPPTYNDQHRLDKQKNATCLSIGHPNYKMFWGLQKDYSAVDWVVLQLKKSILWEKDCAFCVKNAAHKDVYSIPLEDRKGVRAFKSMFDEVDGKPSRGAMRLPHGFPTNPQAEVLVFGAIEPAYILGAFGKTSESVLKIRHYAPSLPCNLNAHLFSYRHDYAYWK